MNYILNISDLYLKDKIAIIYFYAHWVPYHARMAQSLNFVESNTKDIYFYAINVNWFLELCKQFNIDNVPKILIIKNNKVLKSISGLITGQELLSAVLDIY